MAPARHALSAPSRWTRHELVRTALHLSTALIPVAYSIGAPRRALETLLLATSLLALMAELLRRVNATFDAKIDRTFGPLMREHERKAITGATWLSLGCFGVVLVLSREAAISALWCVTVGDPVAAIAGRWWTARRAAPREGRGGKTVVGTLAFATVSFAGVWMLAGYPPLAAAIVAAAGAAAEAIPSRLDDNILVAGVAGAAAQLLA